LMINRRTSERWSK